MYSYITYYNDQKTDGMNTITNPYSNYPKAVIDVNSY